MVALHDAAVTVTCLPVKLDGGEWQAALFYVVPPSAPARHGDLLPGGPFAVELEADLHEHEHGTVFELGIEIRTPIEPLRGTLLFLTGHSSAHFEALTLLTTQRELPLVIGDEYCNVIWQQRIPLADAHRTGFRTLIDEAVGRDAVIRLTGRYDPDAAFTEAHAKHARG